MPRALAYANPEVLKWARESAGYGVIEAARKIGMQWHRLEMVEEGLDLLTLRQAETAADVYERPLAALFLESPPDEPPPEAQFRRLPGAPKPPWSSDMRLLARRIRRRQEAATELYEYLEESPPWKAVVRRVRRVRRHAPADLAELARRLLGVTREMQAEWATGDRHAPLRGWTGAVEGLGALVMQDGSMELDIMRGFASVDDAVPAIVLNSRDDPRARAFTVIHELGHLLVAAAQSSIRSTEVWANDFAGTVMMPRDWLAEELGKAQGPSLLSSVEAVARVVGVSPLAVAVRIERVGLASPDEAGRVIGAFRRRTAAPKPERTGGHYWRTKVSNLGPAYIRLVLSALDSQIVTYPTASTMLDNVKVNQFETLRDFASQRG